MSRLCGACKGRGWFGSRTALFGNKGGSTCRACGGSGVDENWNETHCNCCRAVIEYHRNWSHVPEYCKACSQWKEKTCINPDCRGTIRYKVYWDSIPDYCTTCKGWREKPCVNPDCRGIVRFHDKWTNVSDYCSCKGWRTKPCKNPDCHGEVKFHDRWSKVHDYCGQCTGWRYKPCANSDCRGTVKYHNDWTHPPNYCEECKRRPVESPAAQALRRKLGIPHYDLEEYKKWRDYEGNLHATQRGMWEANAAYEARKNVEPCQRRLDESEES